MGQISKYLELSNPSNKVWQTNAVIILFSLLSEEVTENFSAVAKPSVSTASDVAKAPQQDFGTQKICELMCELSRFEGNPQDLSSVVWCYKYDGFSTVNWINTNQAK